jgi:hypothetical protein
MEEPGRIGKNLRLKGKISQISRGDRVLYYTRGEGVVVNSFDVVSEGSLFRSSAPDRRAWTGELWAYKIKRRLKKPEVNMPLRDICAATKLSFFPDGKVKGIRLKGKTVLELTKAEFGSIERLLRTYTGPENNLFRGQANEGNLGEPMDLGILNYAPTSEQGVVVLFAHHMQKLPYGFVKMEFVRSGFPDACVLQQSGAHFSRRYIEFEFKASMFRSHERSPVHRKFRCDYIVCWENDYPNAPIPVIELKSELLKAMPSASKSLIADSRSTRGKASGKL